jgi:hypothetical protein
MIPAILVVTIWVEVIQDLIGNPLKDVDPFSTQRSCETDDLGAGSTHSTRREAAHDPTDTNNRYALQPLVRTALEDFPDLVNITWRTRSSRKSQHDSLCMCEVPPYLAR